MEYKQGRENEVANALFRRQYDGVIASCFDFDQSDSTIPTSSASSILGVLAGSEGTLCIFSFPTPSWLSDLKRSYNSDPKL